MTKGKLYDRVQAYEDDGLIDEVHAICKVLDEAKKEFSHIDEEDISSYVIDWFEKWFGEKQE